MSRPPLEVLGLAPGADEAAILKAYRKLCMVHHPDKGGTHLAFVELKAAKEQAIKELRGGTVWVPYGYGYGSAYGSHWYEAGAGPTRASAEEIFRKMRQRYEEKEFARFYGDFAKEMKRAQKAEIMRQAAERLNRQAQEAAQAEPTGKELRIECPRCGLVGRTKITSSNLNRICPRCFYEFNTEVLHEDRKEPARYDCEECKGSGYILRKQGLQTFRMRCISCVVKYYKQEQCDEDQRIG